MALTEDEITAPGTYILRFDGPRLSGKRFRDAVDYAKSANAKYDPDAKTWTVTYGEPGEERTTRCSSCKNGGKDGAYAHRRDEDGLCSQCHGEGEITWRPDPDGIAQLRIVARAYGGIVERA